MLIGRVVAIFQASKVAVLGAAGGIGQPLSLLLKLNPHVSELSLYDIRGGPGKFATMAALCTMMMIADEIMLTRSSIRFQVSLLILATSIPRVSCLDTTLPLPA